MRCACADTDVIQSPNYNVLTPGPRVTPSLLLLAPGAGLNLRTSETLDQAIRALSVQLQPNALTPAECVVSVDTFDRIMYCDTECRII